MSIRSRQNPPAALADSQSPRVAVALLGPTASGKTDAAIKLTQQFPFEIVSVDASQVYRGMSIGTAKPDADTLKTAPHHLIDIRSPDEIYSAALFRRDAQHVMAQIDARQRIPLLVGGSMFYYQALVNGLDPLPSADKALRRQLRLEAKTLGWPALHDRLAKMDPESASRIDSNDHRRIERALEINIVGKPPIGTATQAGSDERQERAAVTCGGTPWTFFTIALVPSDRRLLHERIDARFRQMIAYGLELEVRELLNAVGSNDDLPSLKTVGYRQMAAYLNGDTSFDDMLAQAIAATRQLAKRQLTWLRHRPGTIWCSTDLTGFDDGIARLLGCKLYL